MKNPTLMSPEPGQKLKNFRFPARHYLRALYFALFLFICGSAHFADAHPFGGILQKTYIYPGGQVLTVVYETHLGSTVLIALCPDQDRDGRLSEEENQMLLERMYATLIPNITATVDGQVLPIEKIDETITLETPDTLLDGINIRLTLQMPINGADKKGNGVIRFLDKNFTSGELDRLNYFHGIMADSSGARLLDGGRGVEIVMGRAETGRPDSLPASVVPVVPPPGPPEKTVSFFGNDPLLTYFTDNQFGFRLFLFAVISAFGLGAVHALSPGHGKSMVAAYLVGARGNIRHAVILGLIVTATHVASVVLLGIAALSFSQYFMPQQVMPWIGGFSGAMIFCIGYWMLAKKALHAIDHCGHNHHDHGHHHHHPAPDQGSLSMRTLLSMGFAGGIVPCPTAMVVLLLSLSFSRVAEGLVLILFFSLGLSAVLILIGTLTVKASTFVDKFFESNVWIQRLPVFSAGVVMVIGAVVVFRSISN